MLKMIRILETRQMGRLLSRRTARMSEAEAEKKALADREQQSDKLANDAGFQETLALYIKMPPKKAKEVFQSMDDALQPTGRLAARWRRNIRRLRSIPRPSTMN